MEAFLNWVKTINDAVNGAVWGLPGLILLIGTGILLTVGTKVFQISHIGHWWKNTIASVFKKNSTATKKTDRKTISQFQALCAALAATVGTGNIAGVAAAIVTGGPGAVFWMWVAAFFGMMTNFSENLLGIYYRRRNKDGKLKNKRVCFSHPLEMQTDMAKELLKKAFAQGAFYSFRAEECDVYVCFETENGQRLKTAQAVKARVFTPDEFNAYLE